MEGSWKKRMSWLIWWFRLQPSSHSSLQQVIGVDEQVFLERPLCRCSSVRRTLLAEWGWVGGCALVQVNQTEDHLDEEIGWCLWP